MKQVSTLFLRGVIWLLGLAVLAICTIALPLLIRAELRADADFDYGIIFAGMYLPAIPFFIALYQSLKLLGYIDRNQTFSPLSVKALKTIKYCGGAISALYLVGMPYIATIAEKDDAPGVLAIALVIIFASFVITVFAALLQKLLQNAIDIKAENDLTV